MLTTLPYCYFKSYSANTKLYIILIYRHAACFKSIYLTAANSQSVYKQYTPMILQSDMLLTLIELLLTVNSEIFRRTLFSRNFASFMKIKPLRNGKITLSFIDIGKYCLGREFFTSLIYLLMLFAKIKCSRKFPNQQ